jgi:16S rRNA (guanine(966)-N(2))-methyltransferase RsmD
MRIIAGELRGRRIESPPGLDTRPMLDRVREAMFSTLGARLDGANVLDLFAGSGSLGLEALSRGARCARMIEKDPKALTILKKNVELLGMAERADIVRGDALRRDLWKPPGTAEPFEIVFLDPPYRMVEEPDPRAGILACAAELLRGVVGPGGCLVVHAPARTLDWIRIPGVLPGPERRDERRYGSSGLLYLFADEGGGA